MDYSELVDVFEELENTSETLEKRRILAELFAATDAALLPTLLKLIRGKVFASWESKNLGVSSSLAREAIAKATGIDEEQIEEWWREQGDLGNAASIAMAERTQQTLFSASLTVQDVHSTLVEIADYNGEGSQSRRVDAIAGLISDAEPGEARYLVRTVAGAMRLGVGEGLIRDGLADALLDGSDDAVRAIERAYEVTNDFGIVAERAREGGLSGLAALDVEVFRPIKPMLAHKADSLESALHELGDSRDEVLVERKYDGIRAKVHRQEPDTRLFTRRLEDVSTQFPDVISAVEEQISASDYILEAEVVGFDPESGSPVPFQRLSQRIKRKYDVEELAAEIPVTVFVFDLLYLEGTSFIDRPLGERLEALERILTPTERRIQRAANLRTASLEAVEDFYAETLSDGHEGIMVKNLDATYQPGSRVGYQLKVKPTMEPLDLVVTRAKWSEGRKSDYLGRPYLACIDGNGEFKEVGRMHTGFTDEELAEVTELLEPLIQRVDGREAKLRPEVVLEVEYEEIQQSPKYESGYALRFPRFKQIRRDLDPADADSLERVETLFADQE